MLTFLGNIQDHFMKYVQSRDSSESILILYDGYRSHLFRFDSVVPPHRSHILQPMDDGCFRPFQIKYSQECQSFSRCNGRMVSAMMSLPFLAKRIQLH